MIIPISYIVVAVLSFSLIGVIGYALRIRSEFRRKLIENEERHKLDMQLKDEHISRLELFNKNSEDAFKALSSEALRKNNEMFLQIAKSSFSEYRSGAEQSFKHNQQTVEKMVEPLLTSLKEVDNKIAELEKNRVGAYEGIKEQLTLMADLHKQLGNETSQLAKALRSPTTRGMWGELQLKRVVEMAGMVEHCDFLTQVTKQKEQGAIRPDMVVRLPGDKEIVVDSKVPIFHYLEAMETDDESQKSKLLDQFVAQVKRHIQNLSQKSYWDQFENTPEFVVLFLPGEVYFSTALKLDPTLIEKAIQQKVIMATPTTLIALLRAVSFGWQQDSMTKNAKLISETSKTLVKRLGDFSGHFKDIARYLNMSVGAYNKAVGSFDARVMASARKLSELGVQNASELPEVSSIDAVPKSLKYDPDAIDLLD